MEETDKLSIGRGLLSEQHILDNCGGESSSCLAEGEESRLPTEQGAVDMPAKLSWREETS